MTRKQIDQILEKFLEILLAGKDGVSEAIAERLIGQGSLASVLSAFFQTCVEGEMYKFFQEPMTTVNVPIFDNTFSAKEAFVCDVSGGARVKIHSRSEMFTKAFLSDVSRTFEQPKVEHTLRCAQSHCDLTDQAIALIVGEKKIKTTLEDVSYLMALQGDGREGLLLTSGENNLFFVEDPCNLCWDVTVCWDKDGWAVDAIQFEHLQYPFAWNAGSKFFFLK